MVEAVIALVWVWQDCQSFAHLPTPPTFAILLPHALIPGQFTLTTILVCWLLTHRLWTILVSRRHFLPLHELLNAQALAIRILLTAVHSHAENFPPVSHFHAQEFLGFYPRRFLCGLVNGVAESFPHGSNCGFGVDYYPRPG